MPSLNTPYSSTLHKTRTVIRMIWIGSVSDCFAVERLFTKSSWLHLAGKLLFPRLTVIKAGEDVECGIGLRGFKSHGEHRRNRWSNHDDRQQSALIVYDLVVEIVELILRNKYDAHAQILELLTSVTGRNLRLFERFPSRRRVQRWFHRFRDS
ncbi:unnamed protein product [Dibothriocephalus latus]|uniref:Uncharacterized protein n=1 Tax=Dibothriocephalus latus TaxID=60516 RepID=A0A3P6TZS5_DIBLA|nr:unnamed protein product [Dibothriocephalus latus]